MPDDFLTTASMVRQIGDMTEAEKARIIEGEFEGPRAGRAPHAGLTYQGRYDDPVPSEWAANAASEFGHEEPPKPPITLRDRREFGLVLLGSALVVIGLAFALA